KSHTNVSAISAIDVLADAGLLIDDRTSAIDRYFTRQISGLPTPMTAQLRIWFDVMINGSSVAPRRRPRDPKTAKLHIRAAAPILRIWAAQGHDSLAEIETNDIIAVLPAPGPRRHLTDQGLRSIFGILKARKQVFTNPTNGLPHTRTNTTFRYRSTPPRSDPPSTRPTPPPLWLSRWSPSTLSQAAKFADSLSPTSPMGASRSTIERSHWRARYCHGSPRGSTTARIPGPRQRTRIYSSTVAPPQDSPRSAGRSLGNKSTSPHKHSEKIESSTRSEPQTETSAEYANSSGSALKAPCAMQRP
ncbi:MAG: hypothetical protein GY953_16840, partial [bacterium]|nr:hypothetical protein [bacterium]